MAKITGCVVFTADVASNVQNDGLGEKITHWLQTNPFATIEDKIVTQSDSFISVVLFFGGPAGKVNPLDM